MKIIVPKHVEWWMFDMWVDVWPFRVKMWQLILLMLWWAATFGLANSFNKKWMGRTLALIIASPIFLFTLFVAFFKKSELAIIPFTIKLIRTYIIWTTRTYQRNIIKPAEREIKLNLLKMNKWEEKKITKKGLNKDELEKDLEIIKKRS